MPRRREGVDLTREAQAAPDYKNGNGHKLITGFDEKALMKTAEPIDLNDPRFASLKRYTEEGEDAIHSKATKSQYQRKPVNSRRKRGISRDKNSR